MCAWTTCAYPLPPTRRAPAPWGPHSHHQALPPKVNAKEKGRDIRVPTLFVS